MYTYIATIWSANFSANWAAFSISFNAAYIDTHFTAKFPAFGSSYDTTCWYTYGAPIRATFFRSVSSTIYNADRGSFYTTTRGAQN